MTRCYQHFFVVDIVWWYVKWTFVGQHIIGIRCGLILNNSFLHEYYFGENFKSYITYTFWSRCASIVQNLHLSKLIIEPTPAVADNGVVYSNCFRRRTNHQSTANIAKATNLIPAHSPTYLFKMNILGKSLTIINYLWIFEKVNNLLVSKRFNIIDKTTTTFFAACRFPQKARWIN